MMSDRQAEAFTVATDDLIASVVLRASGRLVVVAPAVSCVVGDAICRRLRTLSAEAVTLVLDSDPEVYRLGYGQLEALEGLQRTAAEHGCTIRRQPGVRIGVVIADDQTLIYVPTAGLVEAGPNTHGAANAIRLQHAPRTMEMDLGLADGAAPQIGRNGLTVQELANVKSDLAGNPPLKFDLTRKVRVFNSFIEFAELEVRGTEVARRTVAIPSYLLAVADAKTREQLRTTFRLVSPDDKLSGADIDRDRNILTKHLLHVIPKHGTVVLQRDKNAFLAAVEKLEDAVAKFADRVKASIQGRIDKNVAELTKSLLPGLAKRPPKEWILGSGERPSRDSVRLRLERELRTAFGTADQWIREMKVRCVFKGVTYELLNDPDFIEAATRAIPELERFHTEIDAAEAKKEPSGQTSQSLLQD